DLSPRVRHALPYNEGGRLERAGCDDHRAGVHAYGEARARAIVARLRLHAHEPPALHAQTFGSTRGDDRRTARLLRVAQIGDRRCLLASHATAEHAEAALRQVAAARVARDVAPLVAERDTPALE